MTAATVPVEERLVKLLDHLGIAQTHIAGRTFADVAGLAAHHPGRVASLSLLCPFIVDADVLRTVTPRLLERGGAHCKA
jgi:pimeloyl-ACP methyl ester carboxylesterase